MSEAPHLTSAISREVQHQHLIKVSRTFALTIPFLPESLADVVSNAYLLCRIADTVEDDPKALVSQKVSWLRAFGHAAGTHFRDPARVMHLQHEALELLHEGAKRDEYALMAEMHRVIARTRGYHREVLGIVCRGVEILSLGMAKHLEGMEIKSLEDVDSYCYAVAGVVGQMLARLFAEHNHQIDAEKLDVLSVSFGEGLQLTNILKDRFSDKEDRNSSYLPAAAAGEEVKETLYYASVTQGHLDDAVSFILLIPRLDAGVRLFCLTNTLMAMLTLKKIVKNPQGPSSALKISRRCVKFTVLSCMAAVRSNLAVRFLALVCGLGNARLKRDPQELHQRVSLWNKGV